MSTKLMIVAAISIFSGIYNFFLLERTGLYSLGINSIFQAISRCIAYFTRQNTHLGFLKTILFWGMTLVINIPFAWILGYRRIGKNFTILSIFAICVSSFTSILLSSFPQSWGLKDFYIFSDPRTFNKCLTDEKINILMWNYASSSEHGGKEIYFYDSSNVALMFFYGFVFGVLNTFTSMIIYSLGGSTGGMDWIVFYMSKKRMNSTNNIFLYIGLSVTFISYLIGTYIPYLFHMLSKSGGNQHSCSKNIEDFNNRYHFLVSNLFGPAFVSTAIAAFTKRILFNFFYPNFKLINVRIFTNKFLELRKLLLSSDFPHGFTINSAIGGYLLRRQTVFEITCFALELKTIKEHTRKIDPNCLIVCTPIKSLSGHFFVRDNLN